MFRCWRKKEILKNYIALQECEKAFEEDIITAAEKFESACIQAGRVISRLKVEAVNSLAVSYIDRPNPDAEGLVHFTVNIVISYKKKDDGKFTKQDARQ